MQFTPAQIDESGLPPELELADGTRLVAKELLDCRVVCTGDERITLQDALSATGQPFAGFELRR